MWLLIEKKFVADIRDLEATHPPPPMRSDGFTLDEELEKLRRSAKEHRWFIEKKLVTITHNELTFHASDDQRYAWQEA